MKATELIADLRAVGPQDLCVVLTFLAERVPSARLADGQSLRDATDFMAWLHELAAASSHRTQARALLPAASRTSRWEAKICPVCFHEHEGKTECLKYLGEEKFCKCEEQTWQS